MISVGKWWINTTAEVSYNFKVSISQTIQNMRNISTNIPLYFTLELFIDKLIALLCYRFKQYAKIQNIDLILKRNSFKLYAAIKRENTKQLIVNSVV